MKTNVGIIGCGSIATASFAPSLLDSAQADLVAVCRRDLTAAQEFARQFGGCRAYGSAAELLADDQVEAVIVATPTDSHRDLTCEAAALGKHVLCEKPMALDRHECRDMMAACEQHGVALAVAYRRRLFPQVTKAKELIAAGEIGRIVCARTHYSGNSGSDPNSWRMEPGLGGSLMEMAVHRLEVLLNFTDRPRAVMAMIDTIAQDWPVDDTNALLIRFADGMIGMHSTILTSPPRRDVAQIDGLEGRIVIDSLEAHSDRLRIERPDGDEEEVTVTPLVGNLFDQPMIEDWLEAGRSGTQPVCDGETGYWVQAVVDAARESANTGALVEVEVLNS